MIDFLSATDFLDSLNKFHNQHGKILQTGASHRQMSGCLVKGPCQVDAISACRAKRDERPGLGEVAMTGQRQPIP